jgi:hypothetical protein
MRFVVACSHLAEFDNGFTLEIIVILGSVTNISRHSSSLERLTMAAIHLMCQEFLTCCMQQACIVRKV